MDRDRVDSWMLDTVAFDGTAVLNQFDIDEALRRVNKRILRGVRNGALLGTSILLILYGFVYFATI